MRGIEITVKVLDFPMDAFDEGAIGCKFAQPLCRDLSQHPDGIGATGLPQIRIHLLEEIGRRWMPGPAQIQGQFLKTGESFWQDRTNGKATNGLHGRHRSRRM